MKIDKRSWIPILGIIFALNDGGWLFLYEEWLRYQLMCLILLIMPTVLNLIF